MRQQVVLASCPWGWPGAQQGYVCAPFWSRWKGYVIERGKMQDTINTGWSWVLVEPSTPWLAEFSPHSQSALSLQIPPPSVPAPSSAPTPPRPRQSGFSFSLKSLKSWAVSHSPNLLPRSSLELTQPDSLVLS